MPNFATASVTPNILIDIDSEYVYNIIINYKDNLFYLAPPPNFGNEWDQHKTPQDLAPTKDLL